MDLGKINEHSTVLDTGKMTIGKWEIKNHDYHIHPYPGNISLEYLFEHSSNIGSINVARMMSPLEFYGVLKNSVLEIKQELIYRVNPVVCYLTGHTGIREFMQQWHTATAHRLLQFK